MKATRVNQAFKYAKEHDIKGVTKKSILEYIKEIEPNKAFKGKQASKQFVFNYIGGWFADIGFNRNKEMGKKIDGDNWLRQFVLFVNGNSGWAKVYEAPSKDREVVSSIVQRFINDMGEYPVKLIITDNDGAFDDSTLPIKKIQSEVANNEYEEHKNHRLFSRIDTFMSHLRRYAWHEYNVGKVNGEPAKICDQPASKEFYIPLDTIKRFVYEWNEHTIPIVRCTRNEMMKDRDLELAYMCWALYGNTIADKLRESIKGEVRVKSRARFNDLGANRQERAHGERAGVYVIARKQNGHYVGIDKENREVHFNADEVTNIIDDAPLNAEEDALMNVNDEINRTDIYDNMVTKYEGPPAHRHKHRKHHTPQPEPSVEDAAQKMAVDEQLRDFDRGIPPSLDLNSIYMNAKKMLKALKDADATSYDELIVDLASKHYTLTSKAEERLAKRLQRQADKSVFNYQDIPVNEANESGMITKLANQIKERNGDRPNKKKAHRTRKQTTS